MLVEIMNLKRHVSVEQINAYDPINHQYQNMSDCEKVDFILHKPKHDPLNRLECKLVNREAKNCGSKIPKHVKKDCKKIDKKFGKLNIMLI